MSENRETITERETISKKVSSPIIEFNIVRTLDGVEMKVKSPTFEKFFALSGEDGGVSQWHGYRAYLLPQLEANHRTMLNMWRQDMLIVNGFPNLSFLRIKGLSEGVTMKIPQVYSRAEIMKFIRLFKQESKEIYAQYIKPVNVNVEIITETTRMSEE